MNPGKRMTHLASDAAAGLGSTGPMMVPTAGVSSCARTVERGGVFSKPAESGSEERATRFETTR